MLTRFGPFLITKRSDKTISRLSSCKFSPKPFFFFSLTSSVKHYLFVLGRIVPHLWFYLTFTYPLLASALAFLYCYKGKSAYCWHFHYVVRTTYLPRLVKEVCERPLILFTFPFIARRLIDILSAQYSIEFHSMHFWQPSITSILKLHDFPFKQKCF